jgi:hypothetical protein
MACKCVDTNNSQCYNQIIKEGEGNKMKRLVIKDWLWQKIARENGAPRVWGGNIDCVISETEKAYKVIMGAVNFMVITWVPKSQCAWEDAESEFQSTKVCESYEEAMQHVKFIRSCYC